MTEEPLIIARDDVMRAMRLDTAILRGIADADAGRVQDSASLRAELLYGLSHRIAAK